MTKQIDSMSAQQANTAELRAKTGRAAAEGLYDPSKEHDACGVGFIANIENKASREVVEKGLEMLVNLTHRGAVGADPLMGDGAGMLAQIPHKFFKKVVDFDLPGAGEYAVAMLFYPQDADLRAKCSALFEKALESEGLSLIGTRSVPFDNSCLSQTVIDTQPVIEQAFIRIPSGLDTTTFERKLLITRKVISNAIYNDLPEAQSDYGFYVVSMSARTIVYKGMFLAYQLGGFYTDLNDPDFESALALVHQRFSTNTFPSWKLAHPYRMTAHNGEINTIRGNFNWMAARQASVNSRHYGEDIEKIWPISYEGQSDTACFDNAVEFLTRGGYPLPHAAMMLIPEAWANNTLMDAERKAFYEYHAALMEPWDGPAAMAMTDGRYIVATLDRNGLRPARYVQTKAGHVVLASEAGTLSIPEEDIVEKWRLQPGKMLVIDMEEGRVISDAEIKRTLASRHPYAQWLARTQIVLEDLPPVASEPVKTSDSLPRSHAGLRLYPGRHQVPDDPHGHDRPGGRRLDGRRYADLGALGQAEAALHLFQAELRPGHQPADRPDPRGIGDEPGLVHRPASQHLRSRRAVDRQAARSPSADPDQ